MVSLYPVVQHSLPPCLVPVSASQIPSFPSPPDMKILIHHIISHEIPLLLDNKHPDKPTSDSHPPVLYDTMALQQIDSLLCLEEWTHCLQ